MTLKQYSTFGHTGLRVSRLCFGVMNFGHADFFGYDGWSVERDVAESMLDCFLEAGGNFFDTADVYNGGGSEAMLGDMIKARNARDRVVISTKYTCNADGDPNFGGNGRKNLIRAVEGSLERLQTDYIDVFMPHFWDRVTPVEEVLRTMNDLVSAGKIRHFMLSNTPGWYAGYAQAVAKLRGWERPAATQLEYSLFERDIEAEYSDFSRQHDVGIMAWSPLCMGLLSGKYKASDNALGGEGEGRLTGIGETNNLTLDGRFNERNWAILAELENVADKLGQSMAQVALNWVVNRPGVSSVIAGASKLSQLEANIKALDFEIPEELLNKLNEVSAPALRHPNKMSDPDLIGQVVNFGVDIRQKPPSFYG